MMEHIGWKLKSKMNRRARHTPKPRGDDYEEPEWTILTVRNPDNPITYTPTNIRDGLEYGEYRHDRTKLHGPEPLPKLRKTKSKAEFPPCNTSKYVGPNDPFRWSRMKERNKSYGDSENDKPKTNSRIDKTLPHD